MFKKFIKRIIEAENQADAWANVFYGADGIDIAYQNQKISWNEFQMLVDLLDMLA